MDWHGWTINDKSLHIGPLPDSGHICLYMIDGWALNELAYFHSEEQAKVCQDWMDQILSPTE